MIHYHGTPMGGTRVDVSRFLTKRHALVSFYRPEDIGAVLDCCQSFILDNGAFSHWKSGNGAIDFCKYVEWVDKYYRHPSFDWCLIPDIIDGNESDNKGLTERWVTSGIKAKGVPIWHLHESFDYLRYLVDNFDLIAFGSSGEWSFPNSKKWWSRMNEAMVVACDAHGRPRCKLHGLRMMNPAVFTKLPLSSADSTNAAINSGSLKRFGMYIPPTRSQRAEVIADRIEQHNSAAVFYPPKETS